MPVSELKSVVLEFPCGYIRSGVHASEEILYMNLLAFDSPDILDALATADLDTLRFGVIGFDSAGLIQRYNKSESEAAGLATERVLGRHVFETVAPCMNNFMVAQRFEDASALGAPIDETINYVLTLKMRPTPVRLRLLQRPSDVLRYILVTRT